MDEEEIALNDARRVDQRHRRQAEDAELAEGPEPKDGERSSRINVARSSASRPAPRLTDDSMLFFQTFELRPLKFSFLELSFRRRRVAFEL